MNKSYFFIVNPRKISKMNSTNYETLPSINSLGAHPNNLGKQTSHAYIVERCSCQRLALARRRRWGLPTVPRELWTPGRSEKRSLKSREGSCSLERGVRNRKWSLRGWEPNPTSNSLSAIAKPTQFRLVAGQCFFFQFQLRVIFNLASS